MPEFVNMSAVELEAEAGKLTVSTEGANPDVIRRVTEAWQLNKALSAGVAKADRMGAVKELIASVTQVDGLERAKRLQEIDLIAKVEKQLLESGKKAAAQREGGLEILTSLVSNGGKSALPIVVPVLSTLLSLANDKNKNCVTASAACIAEIMAHTSEFAPRVLLPELLKSTSSWQANLARVEIVTALTKKCPGAVRYCLSETIPAVADILQDLKKSVKKEAKKALNGLIKSGANPDVLPLAKELLAGLADPTLIAELVQTLASTTFVQTVDGPTLAIIAPILVRGFAVRSDKTKRACARIIENMSKLVESPNDLEAFLPQILPRLESARDHVATPEAREVCNKACEILSTKSAGMNPINWATSLVEALKAEANFTADTPAALAYTTYASHLVCSLADQAKFDEEAWNTTVLPILNCVVAEADGKKVLAALRGSAASAVEEEEDKEDDEDAAVEALCDCEFSLAYGNKVLLRKTQLRLRRGFKYGLIGKNDSGKTSLMRAIADHRVEGFPEEHVLRTVFVETDIKAEFADMSVIEYMMADKLLESLKISLPDMTKTLNDVGFCDGSPANTSTLVGSLSGGWRMKVALARAMLLNADILLLDEPTNHLDSYNVQWVEDWLMGMPNVTAIMVSHDSGFLNRVCTHIVSIDQFRLSFHKGNLQAFAKKNPAMAEAFFELKTTKYAFKFPPPSRLKGIKSKGKAIMKMTNVAFTYPGAPKPQLTKVTIQVSLGSRVACVGVNGAGKSTMIKLLTGELEPDKGSGAVWTHPNMQYGYIAQHAFHHIENHLDKSANEYICWRYRYGNDREALNKVTAIISEAEKKAMDKAITFSYQDPESGLDVKKTAKVRRLTEGRRENKLLGQQEYECKLIKNANEDDPNGWWVPRSTLQDGGWEKALKQVDDRINMRESMHARPLTTENVKKHLSDVGLEEEFSSHMRIGALSGGQKVKVVLGAALWNRPHVLILDEPTNYLDRDSLGALAQAIREFEGGVVMITHNSQFCDNLCPVVWHLENNTLNVMGDAEWMQLDMKLEDEVVEEANLDRFGNTIVVKKKLTGKALKQAKKAKAARRKARIKAGGDPYDTDEGY